MAEFCYEHYMALQWVELFEHKWYLGERLGRDPTENEVGFDWVNTGHNIRFRQAYFRNLDKIESFLSEYEQKGDLKEVITKEVVHKLLGD